MRKFDILPTSRKALIKKNGPYFVMVDFLFVVSSEAGHKVGGIYTVLRTMSGELVKKFKENLVMIGMYDPKSAKEELEEEEAPKSFQLIFNELRQHGINCRYGRWVKGSNARLILLEAYLSLAVKVFKDFVDLRF